VLEGWLCRANNDLTGRRLEAIVQSLD
jgi:hypothetical protein